MKRSIKKRTFVTIAVIAVFVISRKLKKSEKKIAVNRKLKLLFEVPFHPFNSFDELRYKDMGSVPIAIVLLILLQISLSNQIIGRKSPN